MPTVDQVDNWLDGGAAPGLDDGIPTWIPPGESRASAKPIGERIDAKIGAPGAQDRIADPDRPANTEPKKTPPTLDEWMDFFSRVVIRFLTEWYADRAFRGIDESVISPDDLAKIHLSKEDRESIARPFAEYSNTNDWTRKHGREIVAISGSLESIMILSRWTLRVNRIARKYRPKPAQPGRPQTVRAQAEPVREQEAKAHEHNGQSRNGSRPAEAGPAVGGFSIVNPGGG